MSSNKTVFVQAPPCFLLRSPQRFAKSNAHQGIRRMVKADKTFRGRDYGLTSVLIPAGDEVLRRRRITDFFDCRGPYISYHSPRNSPLSLRPTSFLLPVGEYADGMSL